MGRGRNLPAMGVGPGQEVARSNAGDLMELEAAVEGASFGGKSNMSVGDTATVNRSLAAIYIQSGIARSPGSAAADDVAAQEALRAQERGEQTHFGQHPTKSVEFITPTLNRDDATAAHFGRLADEGKYVPSGTPADEADGATTTGSAPVEHVAVTSSGGAVVGGPGEQSGQAEGSGNGGDEGSGDRYDGMTVEQLRGEHRDRMGLSGHTGKNRPQLLEELRADDEAKGQ